MDRGGCRGLSLDINAADPDRPPVHGDHADPLAMDVHTGTLGGSAQRQQELAVVDAVVARDVQRRPGSR